ncbi:MAG: ATP-binding protein [Bryobacteraceae bacterium]
MNNPVPGSAVDFRENRQVARRECARRSLPGALVFSLVMVVVWFCTDYGTVFPAFVAVVTVLLFALGLVRILTATLLVRDQTKAGFFDGPGRLLHFAFYASVIGTFAVWGIFSGYTAFQYVAEPKGLLVLLSSAALVAGATTSLAPDRRLAWLCVGLISLPTIAGALLRPETEFRAFALLSFVYYLFLLAQTYMNWKSFWTGYRVGEVELARLEAVRLAAAKSLLLATMSHEIRTPMNGVVGMIELVLRTDLPDEARGYANHARASALNLLDVLNGILAFSRNEKAGFQISPTDFDLGEWLYNVAYPFACEANTKGIKFDVLVEFPEPAWYRCDPIRLSEVLSNLLSNAIKFTSTGGITVRVSRDVESAEQHRLHISVRDTGTGMSAAVQAQLFEPFGHSTVTPGRRGAGLGLAITRQIMDALGGRITVESQPGKGSAFLVSLSMAPAQQQPPQAAAAGLGESGHGLSALVVEDDPVSGLVAKRLLEKLGVKVDLAVNGREALECVSGHYDLFLLDVKLPDADGIEIAATIRKLDRHPRAFIVVVSANQSEEVVERGMEHGVDAFLAKPYTALQLGEMVKGFAAR